MSREIKFRAWFDNGKAQDMFFVGDAYGTTHPLDCCRYAQDGQPVTLMQFTGLTDKNGVEIYESDIVSVALIDSAGTKNKYTGKVFYQEYEFCIETDDNYWPVASWHCVYECEVIGNIYQNQELLK